MRRPPPPRHNIDVALGRLAQPRKHYQLYYARREANAELMAAPQGLHDFLRAYYHHKSGDWTQNTPHPLAGWTADALAELPTYYIMDHDRTMPETVALEMPHAGRHRRQHLAAGLCIACVCPGVWAHRVPRAACNTTASTTTGIFAGEQELFSGRTINVPSLFISGKRDWGVYQVPGALDRMRLACTDMRGIELVDGAGHWPQQEGWRETAGLIKGYFWRCFNRLLKKARGRGG